MANRLYNKQVTPKGYKMGGRVKKMGGGMMKRKPMMKGSKPDFLDLDKDNNKTESMKSAAASAKKMMKDFLKYNRDLKAKGGPVDKKKKKKKFPDLTGDGKVTFADVLKGRGVINGKIKKKKVI